MTIRKTVTKDLEIPLLDNEDSSDEGREIEPFIKVKVFKIMNSTFGLGFLFGATAQFFSLYIITLVYFQASYVSITNQSVQELVENAEVPFALYILCRYWFLVAFILPLLVTVIVQKYRTRSHKIKVGNSNLLDMEAFFECARFQLGMVFGSFSQMSLINFYAIVKTHNPATLIPYFAGVLLSAMLILCLLRTCVEQTCTNVSSIDVVIRYGDDQDDEENPN